MDSLISSALLAVAIVFPILATLAIALRFYAHRLMVQKLQAHDWTIVIALLMCWTISINTFVAAGIGGVNMSKLEPIAGARVFLRALWIEGIPLGIGLAVIKISILLFYRQIFTTKSFRLCVDITITVLVGWGISTVFTQIFAANPISGAWNPLKPSLQINYGDFAIAVAGMSLVFDVMVLCFPLPVIKNLHMGTRRKVIIASIFWLGAFCCVAAAVRFWILYKEIFLVSSSESGNRYTLVTEAFIWSHIEPSCSIIAACLPTYGPFFINGRFKLSLPSSLRPFLSFESWWSNGSKSTGDDQQSSASGSAKAGTLPQSEKSSRSVGVTSMEPWPKRNDLEAQTERPMRILVTKGFGAEHERA